MFSIVETFFIFGKCIKIWMKVKKATLLMGFNYLFLAIIQQSRSLRRKAFSRSQTGLISIFPSFTVSDARHADGAF
jgi:hypothetical protein